MTDTCCYRVQWKDVESNDCHSTLLTRGPGDLMPPQSIRLSWGGSEYPMTPFRYSRVITPPGPFTPIFPVPPNPSSTTITGVRK